MTEEKQNESEPVVEYEIELRSDGISCVRATIHSETEAISFSRNSVALLDAITLGQIINELETYCVFVDGYAIMEKEEGIPDDLRLAVTTAVRYPAGLPDEIVQNKLGIKPNSRRPYINNPNKRTSKFLSYDKKAKLVFITPGGIKWALSELKVEESEDSRDNQQITESGGNQQSGNDLDES